MRVISNIAKLVAELEWSREQLAHALDIDWRSAQKLLEDSPNWELKRATLHKLLLLGFQQALEPFEVRHHELWDTFMDAPAVLFRRDLTWDSTVEKHIRDFLAHLDCSPTLVDGDASEDEVQQLMRTHNCVFIGSPKANRASENALAAMAGGRPFDPSSENRKKMQFQLLGGSPEHRRGQSAFLSPSTSCEVVIRKGQTRTPLRVKVDWLPEEKFRSSTSRGKDAAVVVVCRHPLETQANVTTIVVSGYTGLATEQAALGLLQGEPPISQVQLEASGVPLTIAYRFEYRKRRHRGEGPLSKLRTAVPESGEWLAADR